MLTVIFFLCLARWSHQSLLARLNQNGSLYSKPEQRWIPIAIFGNPRNHSYSFHPSSIQAPSGAILRFSYYSDIEGSLYLWKGNNPCMFNEKVDAIINTGPPSSNGTTFADVQVNGSVTQYLSLNKTFVGGGCQKTLFTLRPLPTGASVPTPASTPSAKACKNHHRASANSTSHNPSLVLPSVVTAPPTNGTTSSQLGGFTATTATGVPPPSTSHSSRIYVGILGCLAFFNALVIMIG